MGNGKKIATIYDIAKAVDLSPATVSRALNGKGYISADSHKKVLQAAKRLNYQPNQIAKSLKTSETRQIILAVSYIEEIFNFEIIAAVQEVVQNNSYSLVLYYTGAREEEELKVIDNLSKNNADALILTSVSISDKVINKINNINKPCVLSCFCKYDEEDSPFDYVGVDTQKGIYLAVKHLIDQGHTKISYIGAKIDILEGKERYSGYCLAMEQNGLSIDPDFVFLGEHDELFGYESGRKLLKSGKLPTAICCATDLIAMGIYRAFEDSDIKFPDDIAVTGMDNIQFCTFIKPKLTSVSIVQGEIGRMAANIIFDRLRDNIGEKRKNIIFLPRLIIRESSMNYYNNN